MKKTHLSLLAFALLGLVLWSCSQEPGLTQRIPKLPATVYNYQDNAVLPSVRGIIWGSNDNTPQNNKTTNEGATLGRVLFYDKVLSLNNSVACGSCHKQNYAFADNVAFSTGFEGKKTARNSMAVFNCKNSSRFFWDTRAATLEAQTTMPVQNHVEMGLENLDNLVLKLSKTSYYAPLFQSAFGTTTVTKERITMALAQFMRSITTHNSKFDQGRNNNFSNFSSAEKDGLALFTNMRCAQCHNGENLNGDGWDLANIGLDETYTDKGLMNISNYAGDDGRFKVASLRNIALTAPYMHDGRYNTLEEVVNHYNNMKSNPNLDVRLTDASWCDFCTPPAGSTTFNHAPHQFNMTDIQKKSLVAFLNTLTDQNLINDVRFADPFK